MSINQLFVDKLRLMLSLTKWAIITLLLAITVTIIGVGTLLGSESGRLWLTQLLLDKFNQSSQLHIAIDGLSSPHIGRWHATSIQIHQDQQIWIRLETVALHWNPEALFDRRIVVNQLQADTFAIHKLSPSAAPVELETSGGLPDFNDLKDRIPNILLKRLAINSLQLQDFSADQPSLNYRVGGSASWLQHSPIDIRIQAVGLGHLPVDINLQLQSQDWSHAKAEGVIKEPAGGVIGQLLQLPSTQAIDAALDLSINYSAGAYSIEIKKLHTPLLQREISAEGFMTIEPLKKSLIIDKLNLMIDKTQHSINGAWVDQQLDFAITLQSFPLDITKFWQTYVDSGEVSAEFKISGTVSQPVAQGSLNVSSRYRGLPIAASVVGSINSNLIEIMQLKAKSKQTEVTAQGTLDVTSGHSNLDVYGKGLDLQQLQLFDIELPNDLKATVTNAHARLHGAIKEPQGELSFTAAGEYLQEPFSIESRVIKDKHSLLIKKTNLTIAETTTVVTGTVDVRTLISDLAIETNSFPLHLLQLIDVTMPETLEAQLDSRLKLTGDLRNPSITGSGLLHGYYQAAPFSLDAQGHYQSRDYQLTKFDLTAYGDTILSASGHYQLPLNAKHFKEGVINLQAKINQIPNQLVTALEWHIQPGDFSAEINALGTLQRPLINGKSHYQTIITGYNEEGEEKEISFQWGLELTTDINSDHHQRNSDRLRLASTFKRNNHPPGELLLTMPIEPYLNYAVNYPTSSLQNLPLQADLKGSFNLQIISFLLDPDIHRLTGLFETDIALNGNFSQPKLKGRLQVENAQYENQITGTLVNDINCSVDAQQAQLNIDSCQANDGSLENGKGQYVLNGTVTLPVLGDSGLVDAKLKVQNANILRRPDIESEATGEIFLTGNFSSLLASGNLEVAPFTAVFDTKFSSGIPSIEVEEVQPQTDSDAKNRNRSTFLFPKLKFDLQITASNQAFLRGHGLEAELQGEIDIHGDSKKTLYEGEFKTVRGVFNLFNKKFYLTQGQVNFANNTIGLAVTGVYEKNGQRIQADLSGTNDNITLNFTAVPQIPEDEILAFIIFGKSLQKITPFEAIQLASAVQALRSGDNGFFDPIGKARNLLGVDTLSIESASTENGESGVNVGIGKYLNERVYLELERTPNPSQPWKGNLQIELTPSINLESSTGGQSGIEGAELKWKRDY